MLKNMQLMNHTPAFSVLKDVLFVQKSKTHVQRERRHQTKTFQGSGVKTRGSVFQTLLRLSNSSYEWSQALKQSHLWFLVPIIPVPGWHSLGLFVCFEGVVIDLMAGCISRQSWFRTSRHGEIWLMECFFFVMLLSHFFFPVIHPPLHTHANTHWHAPTSIKKNDVMRHEGQNWKKKRIRVREASFVLSD